MKTLSDLGTGQLVWRYPETRDGVFELIAGGAVAGWLRFDDRAGEHSVGELDGHRWTFQHSSGGLPRVTVREDPSTELVAEFVPWLTGGGVVTFAGGRRYCWNRSGIWSPTWCFRLQGEGQTSSICVSQQSGPLRDGGTVRVCGDAAGLPEAPVLLLLAWYLRVLAFELLTEAIPVVG
jgi:hypothetical protein